MAKRHSSLAAQHGSSLWVVVPCMGRLSFLRQTLPRVLAQPQLKVCLVDYSCPDRSGAWLEAKFPQAVAQGRAVVERVPGQALFHKCRAHNAGARRARREGADYLCFLDADTLIKPSFGEFVTAHLQKDRFLIAALRADGSDMPSMTGLLVVRANPFFKVGGFDEKFKGWGGEDIELRLRLFLLGGLAHGDVPLSLAQPIEHDNSLRTRFYAQHDIQDSNSKNMARVHETIERKWKGRLLQPLEAAERLWYHSGAGEERDWSGTTRTSRGSMRELVRRVMSSRLSAASFAGSHRPGRGS